MKKYLVNVDFISKINAVAIIPVEMWEEYQKNKEEIYSLSINESWIDAFINKYKQVLSFVWDKDNWCYNCEIRFLNKETWTYDSWEAKIVVLPYLKQIFYVSKKDFPSFENKWNYYRNNRNLNWEGFLNSLTNEVFYYYDIFWNYTVKSDNDFAIVYDYEQ